MASLVTESKNYCTEESIEEFNALLDEARDVLENATDQEEIAQMIEALKNAESILKPNEPVKEADKTLLKIALDRSWAGRRSIPPAPSSRNIPFRRIP